MISNSQLLNRQPIACTAYVDMVGPHAGPRVATIAHMATAKGNCVGLQISAKEAPAVARHGEHMKPRRKRRTIRPAKLFTSAVGMQRMTKRKPEMAYGGLRPIAGISERGENRRLPRP